jgi:hypothetical protein
MKYLERTYALCVDQEVDTRHDIVFFVIGYLHFVSSQIVFLSGTNYYTILLHENKNPEQENW